MMADHLRGVAQRGEVVGFVPFLQQGKIGKQLLLLRGGDIEPHLGDAGGERIGKRGHGAERIGK